MDSRCALGVNIAGDTAWLVVVDEQGISRPEPDRFTLAMATDRAQSLLDSIEEMRALLASNRLKAVGILDAHGSYKPPSVQSVRSRVVLETLVELACAQEAVHCEILAPATIQSVLALPTKQVKNHVDTSVVSAGVKWNLRGPGALAGLTMLRRTVGP
jgi:hypothetical protein